VLQGGGLLHVATDWADYARHTHEVMEAFPNFPAETAQGLSADPLGFRPPTKFERRGRRLGHDVFDLYYRLRPMGSLEAPGSAP
jgi:tRNA (guanine-N7-)-methyltransferase